MSEVFKCAMSEKVTFYMRADSEEQARDWMATHEIRDVKAQATEYTIEAENSILFSVAPESDADLNVSGNRNISENVYTVTDIEWDVDKDDEEALNDLPVSVTVTDLELMLWDKSITTEEDVRERMADYLSDLYGFCISELKIGKE